MAIRRTATAYPSYPAATATATGNYGYNGYGYNCGNPAAGAVVGGVAGAAIGSCGRERRPPLLQPPLLPVRWNGGNRGTGADDRRRARRVVGGAVASGNCY